MRKVIIALFLSLFFVQKAYAQEVECPKSTDNDHDTVIVFINGILNSELEACNSLSGLRQVVDVNAEESDFKLFYNPTQGIPQDIAELRLQASISDRATDIAQNDYTIRIHGANARYNFVLGKLYDDKFKLGKYNNKIEQEVYERSVHLYSLLRQLTEQGINVNVVAHSQGNFYIEAAIAIMHYRGEENLVQKIKVVSVAPTSSTTPSGIYFSLEGDKALEAQRKQTIGLKFYKVLPSNSEACIGTIIDTCAVFGKLTDEDWLLHGFVNVYLNPNILVHGISLRNRIRDQISKNLTTVEQQTSNALSIQIVMGYRNWTNASQIMFRAEEKRFTRSGERVYEWSIDGKPLQENRFQFTLFGIKDGKHTLSLTTKSGGSVLGTCTVDFEITTTDTDLKNLPLSIGCN